ncbi:MAG: hypothetical protein H7Y17_00820, partial [Chlorobia bacterium]|nr:hypothetical protein [Fimbriimonadaceae bacterium]
MRTAVKALLAPIQVTFLLLISSCWNAPALVGTSQIPDQEVYGYDGLPISADVPSFMPTHITGPNAGAKACPLCVYGNKPQVQIWVREEVVQTGIKWLQSWDAYCSGPQGEGVQPYLIVVPSKYTGLAASTRAILEKTKAKRVFITSVPSWSDAETSAIYGHSNRNRPNVRVYIAVNRRLFWRVDDPKLEEAGVLEAKVSEGKKFVLSHELTDAQITPLWEPGQRMVIEFQIVDADRPIAGVKVAAHQTDSEGRYNKAPWNRRLPRLETTAWTDQEGKIKFTTVKPGPYPSA